MKYSVSSKWDENSGTIYTPTGITRTISTGFNNGASYNDNNYHAGAAALLQIFNGTSIGSAGAGGYADSNYVYSSPQTGSDIAILTGVSRISYNGIHDRNAGVGHILHDRRKWKRLVQV